MNVVMSLGWAGIVLLVGMVLRAKVGALRKMLIPSSVLGGVIGFLLINSTGLAQTDAAMYSTLVAQLFTISFISVGLTSSPAGGNTPKQMRANIIKGSIGMGLVWNLLYALTPVLGYFVVRLFPGEGMDATYGLLIPFAFAQGPGQAATFGGIFESYGWENAAMVGVTFAAIGFLFAFLVGVPLAKAGMRRGLARHSDEIGPVMAAGILPKDQQVTAGPMETTHNSNVDTMAFHVAVVGGVYVLTYFVTDILVRLVPSLGATLWGMMFMTGMLMSYLVRWAMNKLGVGYLLDTGTQKRITGFCTDFLVVCSFMAVSVSVIAPWIVPILAVCVVNAAVTFFVCLYFGKRFGGENDLERTLGLWGTATGTVPTGIALVRMVDPKMETTTTIELGGMNIPMMISTVTVAQILTTVAGAVQPSVGLGLLLVPIPFYLLALKLCKVWGKKTYEFQKIPDVVPVKK